MSPPRVLIIEDNLTTLDGLTLFLRAEGYSVQTAVDGRDGLEQAKNLSLDLVLLDLMLPDVNGFEVCRLLRRTSDVPIVILTARTTEEDVVQGLELGADDYIRKPFGYAELMARVRRCLRRHSQDSASGVLSLGPLQLSVQERRLRVSGRLVNLTKTEFEILRVLLSKPGRVFTRGQLIDQALGPDYVGFDRTIDTHIWGLRKKLGEVRGNPRYILSEPGIGYRMNHDP